MRQMILAVLAILVLNPGLVQAADSAAPVQKLPAINVEGVVDIPTLPNVLHDYVHLVYVVYKDTLIDGVTLQERVNALLESPSEETLKAARQAWLDSRESYGQTEAFRFYEGPIDFYDEENDVEGPEGRLNSWPLNEAYIDYVAGNPKAGLINDPSVQISVDALIERNQKDDEVDVATGYHAIEFLLWGPDLSLETAGTRPASDFVAGSESNDRRRVYLKAVTDLLVQDLEFLVDQWAPGKDGYRVKFGAKGRSALGDVISALATLSGFEMAAERMATALDSGDQEDEHSCFSDNTHNDFIFNMKGITNIYFGNYDGIAVPSLHGLLSLINPELAAKIEVQIYDAEDKIEALPTPIDREVLATPADSPAREKMEAAIESLQTLSALFKETGPALKLEVEIVQ